MVLPRLLYDSGNWLLTKSQTKSLQSFNHQRLRELFNITREQARSQRISRQHLVSRAEMIRPALTLTYKRLKLVGRIERMPDTRHQKAVLYGTLGTRTGPAPRSFQTQIKKDLEAFNIDLKAWRELAKDKVEWETLLQERMEECNDSWLAEKLGTPESPNSPTSVA